MNSQPKVWAVVLAWNQVETTLECLESLAASKYLYFHVMVVDNASTDDTEARVKQSFPAVLVLRSNENLGVARGYNLGIEKALDQGADYVIVMNNDTVVAPEMVSELVKAFQLHPKAGMVSPKIYHYYGDRTRLWLVGAKWQAFPPSIKFIGYNAPDSERFQHEFSLPFVTGCCMMMSRQALQAVGGFDPGYYFYFEDWDLSTRFWAAGFEIWFAPQAHLWHKVSVSSHKTKEKDQCWSYSMGRGSVRFFLKFKSGSVLLLYTLWVVLGKIVKLKFLQRGWPYLLGVGEGLAQERGWRL
jgi:GT2 family glycosyltransferase